MDKKMITSITILTAVAGFFIVIGIIDGFTSKLLPIHEGIMGMKHDELPAQVTRLMMFFLRILAATTMTIGIALLLLIYGPYKNRENWAWIVICVLVVIPFSSIIYLMIQYSTTLLYIIPITAIVLTFVAMALTKPWMGKDVY